MTPTDADITRIEREIAALEMKLDSVLVLCNRTDERTLGNGRRLDEIQLALDSRRKLERDERREDRRLLIGAVVTIFVAVLGAIATLIASGAFG